MFRCMASYSALADVIDAPTSGEHALAVLVKGHRHDPIAGIERFLNPISVKHVQVNV